MLHIYFQSKLIILILLFTSICNVQCAQHPAIHFEIETDQPCQTMDYLNPEKPDVPLNKNDAFQKVQKRRVQEKR